jgi:hypothetical protein
MRTLLFTSNTAELIRFTYDGFNVTAKSFLSTPAADAFNVATRGITK